MYIGSDDRHLYCLDAKTSEPVWTYTADEPDHVLRLHDMGVDSITTNRVGDLPPLA